MSTASAKLSDRASDNDRIQKEFTKGWKGKIELGFSRKQNRTVLSKAKHLGPLRVQRPFYPEDDVCHVYLLHPPGGVVGGDSLSIDINAESNSHCLLTTPGSTKFYRSIGLTAHVKQSINVEAGACVEWFPQENIFFPGSQSSLSTSIELKYDASFIGWELQCLGRPVNDEKFLSGQIFSSTKIYRDGKLLINETQRVQSEQQLTAASGLRGFPMCATFYATKCDQNLLEKVQSIINQREVTFPIGATMLDDLLVIRVLCDRSEKILREFIHFWQILRPEILNKEAVSPRIWAT